MAILPSERPHSGVGLTGWWNVMMVIQWSPAPPRNAQEAHCERMKTVRFF